MVAIAANSHIYTTQLKATKMKLLQTKDYLLLIDEEAEVCRGQHRFLNNKVEPIHEGHNYPYKGNKVIAYYPLNSEAKELDLPLLPSFEDTKPNSGYEEGMFGYTDTEVRVAQNAFQEGYKAAQSKVQYSLEDMETLMEEALNWFGGGRDKDISDSKEFFEKYIQSLSTQQLPTEFFPGYEIGVYPKTWKQAKRVKTITNSEGNQEIQGKYIW